MKRDTPVAQNAIDRFQVGDRAAGGIDGSLTATTSAAIRKKKRQAVYIRVSAFTRGAGRGDGRSRPGVLRTLTRSLDEAARTRLRAGWSREGVPGQIPHPVDESDWSGA